MTRLLFAPRNATQSVLHIGLSALLYTPDDLKKTTVIYGDYPYSGTLFFDLSRESFLGPKTFFRSEIWLGVLGPAAQGRGIQTFIHRTLDFEIPLGWKNQLPDYPVINYDLYGESALLSAGDYFHINGSVGASIGSLEDNARTGLSFVLSNRPSIYFPALPYSPTLAASHRLYIQWQPSLRYVAYNGILEGRVGQAQGLLCNSRQCAGPHAV